MEKAVEKTEENRERKSAEQGPEDLYAFLLPYAEEEIRTIRAQTGVPMREAAVLGKGLLFQRLKDLAEPTVQAMLEENLCSINPAVTLSPHFASEADRERALRETAAQLRRPEGNPFARYPLLEQDAGRIRENFRSFLIGFLHRLDENRAQIERGLLQGRPMGALLSLSASGADSHLHGQCALRVGTEGGVFYYKPRDSRLDRLYREITERFCPDDTRAPLAVCGEGFGFIECMKTAPVQSREEVSQYYEHFGALTALFRFLGTSDMHYENILACGVYPAAIDMETLFTPASDPYQGCEIASVDEMNPVWRDLFFSTQSTLVLPMMLQGKAQISPLLRGNAETARCLPVLDGKPIPIYGFEESYIGGFSRMYDRLLRDRSGLAEMVRKAEDMRARFVLRASAYYALTLREMHSPAGCASKDARERILADLNRHFEKEPAYTPAVRWERACLEEGDIPYFSFRAGQSGLYGDPYGGILLSGFFRMTAIERCLLTLERSGPEEKRFELDYLRRRFRQGPDSAKGIRREQPERAPEGSPDPLSVQDARAEAVKILGEMDRMALRLTDGKRILLSADKHLVPSHHPNFERGLPGMSLFFDLVQRCPGLHCAETAELLLGDTEEDLLRSRRTYRQMTEAFRGILHPGLRKGVGGLLLSPCMDRDGIADVLDSLMLMTRSYEEEDASLYSGIGGLLAGCLAAAARIGDGDEKEMLSHLIRRLSRLLISRVESAGQVSGLGRGMAGTGLALVQAWQYTGDRALLEAAEKAFSLESGQYRELLRGWPDYGKSPLPVIVGESLEAGAPGIALAAVLSEQAVPAAGELADRALSCTLALPFQETDDLALGNAGIALALTEAACRRSDPGLLKAAGERLAQSAQRAKQDGGYRSVPLRLRNIPDPSFWRGIAGIGYAMLKYAEACEKVQNPLP